MLDEKLQEWKMSNVLFTQATTLNSLDPAEMMRSSRSALVNDSNTLWTLFFYFNVVIVVMEWIVIWTESFLIAALVGWLFTTHNRHSTPLHLMNQRLYRELCSIVREAFAWKLSTMSWCWCRERIYFSTFPHSTSFPFFIFIHWHSHTLSLLSSPLRLFSRAFSRTLFPFAFFPRLCCEFSFFIWTHSNRVITTPSFPFWLWKQEKYSIIVFSTKSNRSTRKSFQKIRIYFLPLPFFIIVISHSAALWQVSKPSIFLPFCFLPLLFNFSLHDSRISSSSYEVSTFEVHFGTRNDTNWQRLD